MTDETQEKKEPDGEYEVGYKKPPPNHQFPKGVSGDPKGRPKGSKNHSTIVKEALAKKTTATLEGKPVKMTMLEVMILGQINKAAKGDTRAFKAMMDEARKAEVIDSNGNLSHGAVYVPGMIKDANAWEEIAAKQQAPHRGNNAKPDADEDLSG